MTQLKDAEIFAEREDEELNVEALRRLVGWAELSDRAEDLKAWRKVSSEHAARYEAARERLETEYPGWGRWQQGSWASFGASDEDAQEAVDLVKRELGIDGGFTGEYGKLETPLADQLLPKVHPCGSAFCMAGEAVLQAGYRMEFDLLVYDDASWLGDSASACVRQEPTGELTKSGWPLMRDVGESRPIPDVAQRILGLNYYERERFFASTNSVADLKEMANEFAAGRGLEPVFA